MFATTSFHVPSLTKPLSFSNTNHSKTSLTHFVKHLQGNAHTTRYVHCFNEDSPNRFLNCSALTNPTNPLRKNPNSHFLVSRFSATTIWGRRNYGLNPLKCLCYGDSSVGAESPSNRTLKNLSFASFKETLSRLTPFDVCKWSGIIFVLVAATKWFLNVLLSPFFWTYFSWTWLFWPWFLALGLAVYGAYCFVKHTRGEANVFEQLIVVTSAFTWLTLVPPAHFNGFLEGWPFVFFFVYHYFFFFNVSVRKRLYGDFYAREHDSKWDVALPAMHRLLFCAGVMVGHWLAAFEGPELHLIPGGWSNAGIWVLIMVTLFMHYNSTLYLAKYSEKVVVPTSVVQFGPYRWVRHPIYASIMLLFATYCIALRAPLSLLFTIAVCLIYYGQKVKVEESLMLDSFGERYTEYISRVKYKFIPFVY
ncbi:hypothetical protein Sjap_001802 [Stephania japonica]|uniref:Protein-S-isoprenylcysteine O-methyltransferase n=1 Tax=Stephania japonica TaxID=461633 RepID=A0AAP0KMY1_9MAGN